MAEGASQFSDLADYRTAREAYDDHIVGWSGTVRPDWLISELSWFSGAAGQDMSMPCGRCVAHFFNHQTHHRGQVHAMLTASGASPAATDLFLMPETL
jgi:uncharacterized damage-inducible protein DinB